jgi:hypothetical protein
MNGCSEIFRAFVKKVISWECRYKGFFFHGVLTMKYHLFKSIHSREYHTGNKKIQNTKRLAFLIFIQNVFAIRHSIHNALIFFVGGTWFPEILVTNYRL